MRDQLLILILVSVTLAWTAGLALAARWLILLAF